MNRIRELREERGLTMKETASQLGMPYTTYVNYEKSLREPNSETLIKLASFFNVSVDYLLGHVSEPINKSGKPISFNPSLFGSKEPLKNQEQSIESILEEARKKLESADSLMFDGGVATPEAIDSVLKAMEVGMQLAKERTEEEKARAAKMKADILRKVEEMDDK